MADSKKPASKQVMDVSKPGKSAPAATGKPVIVTNRPVLQDPMVVNDEASPTPAAAAPNVKRTGGLVLQPLSAEKSEDGEGDKITVKTKKDAAVQPEKSDKIDLPPMPAIADSIPDEKPAETEEPATEEESVPEDTKEEAEPEAKPELETAKTEPSEEPTADVEQPATTEEPKPKDDEPASPEPENPAAAGTTSEHVTAGAVASRATTVPTTDGALLDEDKAEQAETEHDKSIQKLVDTKQYYLPVNSVEKRRTKRFILLGIVLGVLLALAWVDIALDAGLINIEGVKPVTHFFSN